ncbi:Uncharacterised protein [Mycobacteroides abscessus subsp. abscessus]|uniref:hypothetical protein n=1 Tax=Mycobacteroides abscessus TaxID=36809 RepID=UPI0009A71D77|nr:hypothetical protein [Mycobacteroides abscessus]SLJ40550.1 Uncharacterised protein [Mycobacteroides abscessus subsp. abscessus]
MIWELWATPSGQIFWQLDNWGGFYKCEPLTGGSDKVDTLPADARPLINDGKWITGVMEAAEEEGQRRIMEPDWPTERVERPHEKAQRERFERYMAEVKSMTAAAMVTSQNGGTS